ncbi:MULTISPECIES: cyclopropane-fatty-acyl-phospholipid synthase family protein [Acinetobacter]|uniref:SAM-dependent methyltransferase n=1 Tax=Acinetobacter TaxID=469 RepID=UPI000536DFEB|nr:methyltransferase domain-containing protein [Acinetobacter sp. HR7]KGT48185.1 hypothetical protein GW12_07790 [Acinetobacter sp. HR7]
MKLFQALRQRLPEHKYAINAALLGDLSWLPWSNLGYWQAGQTDYVAACQALADHLAQAIHLNAKDKLLDLGCGQGASLQHWQQHYQVQYLAGVELQQTCVSKIQQHLPELNAIYNASFLRLKDIRFPQKFDAVVCIDAAYHSNIPELLEQMRSVLNSKARIGFHHLALSERWKTLNSFQKRKYQFLLKSADVNLNNLMSVGALYECLDQHEFMDIQVEDLSEEVFASFARYVEQDLNAKGFAQSVQASKLDHFKIQMTAKLCRKLYEDGVVRYVQISATAQH